LDPHGGVLVDLLVGAGRAADLRQRAFQWPSWQLTPRQLCDLELLACGGFSPLRGFLGEDDYDAVCRSMRLADGTLWPMPVTLDLPERVLASLRSGGMLALRDPEGVMVAALQVAEVWRPDPEAEAEAVFGTVDPTHPGVDHLLHRTNPWYVSGPLEVLELPEHPDFRFLRRTPAELRVEFARRGWSRIVAFNTRNPMHRAHQELTLRAARQADASLLIHPVVGLTKAGDIDHYTRVRCYQALLPSYPRGRAMLSLLPLAMRMGGPRETLWHALIRRNYGATHFIVGRDQVGPGLDASGHPFYRLYEAQELAQRYEAELGVQIVPFRQMVYLEDAGTYVEEDEVPPGARALSISGTELRRRLTGGDDLPEWFTPAAVAAELRRGFPPRAEQGFTVFFTGLSGAGKSTIANALLAKLLEGGGRTVTLLDGDVVRQHLSNELGFSRDDRDLNIRRIAFVAAEITKHRGIALCAPIAPYDRTRREVRQMFQGVGGFVLVHVATPLEVCEQRDRKGLYAKARAGLLPQFTGVSDPYEEPRDAEIVIDTQNQPPEEAVRQILKYLSERGFLDWVPSALSEPADPDELLGPEPVEGRDR
ncbi:MAG TPA: bifunctional sulfate adenylyltransferase/adenylylsulfate kinase, partial [Gemmatimonadota bacterium]|nr:bifunctional sulfate adenylyltransferase/adenylylsulfate kinase [Gemmatimonadota bacterium]